jgi:hypothetical protein
MKIALTMRALALALAFACVFTLRTVATQNKAELPYYILGSWCVEEDDESDDWDELLKPHGQCRKDNGGSGVHIWKEGISGPGRGICEFDKVEHVAMRPSDRDDPDVYFVHANCRDGSKYDIRWTLNLELAWVHNATQNELRLTYLPEN